MAVQAAQPLRTWHSHPTAPAAAVSGKAASVFDERYKILKGHKVIRLTRGPRGVVVRAWCPDGWEYEYSVNSIGEYMGGNRAFDVRHANGNLLNEKDGI